MVVSKLWQSRVALFLAIGTTSTLVLPLTIAQSATAHFDPVLISQQFPDSWRNGLPSGTQIPVTYEEADRIILTPEETVPVTLIVTEDVVNDRGRVVIPEGSQIEGELQPSGGGTRFVSKTLILDDETRVDIDAVSNVVNERETITENDDPDILRGAAIGGAAGAVLGEILGSIDVAEVLIGAGVGVLAEVLVLRDRREVEVIVVRPEELSLRLRSAFAPN
ncbi:MAG: hypothetical protein HC769_08215 [Cyanobacteria bacterium CRU_2_1]|nr:hypothetical protein [Cyanobacteria bacterium RU_5_0]NJR58834.1 hypothetical protein [Cyanobacteria bacterium CRU_2_1]